MSPGRDYYLTIKPPNTLSFVVCLTLLLSVIKSICYIVLFSFSDDVSGLRIVGKRTLITLAKLRIVIMG